MSPSDQITSYIDGLPDWQSAYLRSFRELIHAADPAIEEAWKWSTPVYVHGGLVCATGVFKDHVKINFFKGAAFTDQSHFNAGLESKQSRSIDYWNNDVIDRVAIESLVTAAVAHNTN